MCVNCGVFSAYKISKEKAILPPDGRLFEKCAIALFKLLQ